MSCLLLLLPMRGFAVQTTTVQGVVYLASGAIAQGTILVSWPAFTAADGSTIAAGNTTVTIASDGSVNIALAPNAGSNPAGTYYTAVYHMSDGTVHTEYWVVPQTTPATISAVRATVVPAAVAQQTVSQQYLDSTINALQGTYLQLQGGTMNGALNLAADPTSALQAATKEYVDAHTGAQLPQAQTMIAGKGDGSALPMAEKGVAVTASGGSVAWSDDLNAGIYDPRDTRWAGGINGPTPAAAAQAMSNQMACDLAMGVVKHAVAKWPQGTYNVDELLIAPGSSWEGVATSAGGTQLHSMYNNHFLLQAPMSMTVTCSDGKSHTDNAAQTHVTHFTLVGCGVGGCSNAPGDTANYIDGGPGNTGLEMSSIAGIDEYIYAQYFGGYGILVDGQDTKSFHDTVYNDLEWYYYGGYKGYGESLPSAEVSVTTTGSTGSVSLSWAAVTNAAAYAVYRGTSAGGENLFYITTTNSFTDTGAATDGAVVTNVVTNTVGAPGTITATASTSGGTLAAGTYFYVVTALTTDGWHGSAAFVGADTMAEWIEGYGFFDGPTKYNYHHLTDMYLSGGDATYSHIWAQLGQVGIVVPYAGGNVHISDSRVDFARLEGFWTNENGVTFDNGLIDASCGASNAQTINTGQTFIYDAGLCQQFYSMGSNTTLSNTSFMQNYGFGPTYGTADMFILNGTVINSPGVKQYQWALGVLGGNLWSPPSTNWTNVTGPQPSIVGLEAINPADTTPTTYTGFVNVEGRAAQEFYIAGGNANVTLQNSSVLRTCNGQNINLGTVTGYLHFKSTGDIGLYNGPAAVVQICDTAPTVSSSETVAFSATPTFSVATRSSITTLTGNVTSFTLGAGVDGQEKTLIFCQNSTGGYTVTAPANVHGFFTVGTTAGKCSAQHFTYSAGQTAWLADSPGVTNE